ncbi:hypothetical protein GCM10018791_72060 [Streptomyces zaomyceticus]|nr:hypothetical protein GCM10018791_72060 [Streptomyces zaomyceticus]
MTASVEFDDHLRPVGGAAPEAVDEDDRGLVCHGSVPICARNWVPPLLSPRTPVVTLRERCGARMSGRGGCAKGRTGGRDPAAAGCGARVRARGGGLADTGGGSRVREEGPP